MFKTLWLWLYWSNPGFNGFSVCLVKATKKTLKVKTKAYTFSIHFQELTSAATMRKMQKVQDLASFPPDVAFPEWCTIWSKKAHAGEH